MSDSDDSRTISIIQSYLNSHEKVDSIYFEMLEKQLKGELDAYLESIKKKKIELTKMKLKKEQEAIEEYQEWKDSKNPCKRIKGAISESELNI